MTETGNLNPLIIQDDGEFYLELNENYPAAKAPGFLKRRCPNTKECTDVLGGFEPEGQAWSCDINASLDEDTGSDVKVLAKGVARIDAIVMLWKHRTQAQQRSRS